jgi:hypothetical protein
MPLDTNLLYGEMLGSWLMHMGVVVLVSVVFVMLPEMSNKTRGLILLGGVTALSFLVQAGLLTTLQASACKGVKDYGSIFTGAAVAAVITAIMSAIPIYFEPMRLAVSQLFGPHKPMLTATEASINDTIVRAAAEVTAAEAQEQIQEQSPLPIQAGGSLDSSGYAKQELREITIGTAYWAAFAGAYGIGLGSLIAAKCPASSTQP